MALSGIEWQLQASFRSELTTIKLKLKEKRTSEDEAVIRYLKNRINELENKKLESVHYNK